MALQQRGVERRDLWSDSERRSARYFHHLIDISPDPFFTIDAQGKIVDSNSAAVIMTGMTSTALVGSVFADYFTNPVEAHEKCQQVLTQGFLNDCPMGIRHASGRTHDVLCNARVVRDESGKPLSVLVIAHDVTAKNRAERDFREYQKRADFALEKTHTGAWELNLVDHTSHRSLEHDRIFGYTELLPNWSYEMFLQHVLLDDRAAVDQKFIEAIKQNQQWNFQCRIRRIDGEIRWIWAVGEQQNSLDGEGQRMVGIVQDITEQKKTEMAIRDAEFRYRTVADLTSDWEYWSLPDGTLRYVSPSCEEVSGYTADEFYADPGLLTRVIHPDDQALFAGHTHQTSERGTPAPILFRIQTKDGETRWISHVCRPVFDEAGNPNGFRGSNRDDTDRKKMEDQVRELAFYDELTQLPNRRLLVDRLIHDMASVKRSSRYGGLMFVDLDNFKPLNDLHGHKMGDLLLVEVAKRMQSCVRSIDTVSRFGGDEFVVLLSDFGLDKAESATQAKIVAEKIRAKLAEPYRFPLKIKGKPDTTIEHRCTASIGVVTYGGHEASEEDILKWADKAMYQAKDAGRNTVRFYEAPDAA
ncbi:MAG: diguanylate cyclase [Polaromonas sp.]|nr:diguanylate cyclase [Polaromonas sp.]